MTVWAKSRQGQDQMDDLDDLDTALRGADPLYDLDLAGLEDLERLLSSLRGVREVCGLSQRQVAAIMRTTQSAVSELEGGLNDPRISTLRRYAAAVGQRLHLSTTSAQTIHSGVGSFRSTYAFPTSAMSSIDAAVPILDWGPISFTAAGAFGRPGQTASTGPTTQLTLVPAA